MSIITVSDLSSLNFRKDWKQPFQQEVPYIQRFLRTDVLQIQYTLSQADIIKPYLKNNNTGEIQEIETKIIDAVHNTYNITIGPVFILEDTRFTLYFAASKEDPCVLDSDFFMCLGNLEGTILFRYTNRQNNFDTVFEEQNLFTFRVDGCFLPQETTFENESENFRDQRYVSRLLSCHIYEIKTLSVGGGGGVPNWVARKLNMIFSLGEVLVDNTSMVRSEGASPELTLLHNDYPLYLYKINLEESYSDLEPNNLGDFNEDYNNDHLIN